MHAYGAKNSERQIKFHQIEYRPTECQFQCSPNFAAICSILKFCANFLRKAVKLS